MRNYIAIECQVKSLVDQTLSPDISALVIVVFLIESSYAGDLNGKNTVFTS